MHTQCAEHAPAESTDGPFDRLLRRDRFVQLVATEEPPREVAARVAEPRAADGEQDAEMGQRVGGQGQLDLEVGTLPRRRCSFKVSPRRGRRALTRDSESSASRSAFA